MCCPYHCIFLKAKICYRLTLVWVGAIHELLLLYFHDRKRVGRKLNANDTVSDGSRQFGHSSARCDGVQFITGNYNTLLLCA